MRQQSALESERRVLEVLASLNYRTGELDQYLAEVARGVSALIGVDWSVVTLCEEDSEQVLASSLEVDGLLDGILPLHGTITERVAKLGSVLAVEDCETATECGRMPRGYRAYLGVPMRTSTGAVIGTICSFHRCARQFDPEAIRVAMLFADRAGSAIENFRLFEQQRLFSEELERKVDARTSELQSAQQQLVEQQRLAAIGEFSAGIVHEISSPLTVIGMALERLQRSTLSSPDRKSVDLAVSELERLKRLLEEILCFAKPTQLTVTVLDLYQALRQLLGELRELPCARGRKLRFRPSDDQARIRADPDKVTQVIINLVANAFEAVRPGDTVDVSVNVAGSGVELLVENGGDPIPEKLLPRLTLPFVSGRSNGTGLGLSIVNRIVHAHGGSLEIHSSGDFGTRVAVRFPRVPTGESG